MQTEHGRAFVQAYYRLSPSLAAVIARDELLRSLTRQSLKPIIQAASQLMQDDAAEQQKKIASVAEYSLLVTYLGGAE